MGSGENLREAELQRRYEQARPAIGPSRPEGIQLALRRLQQSNQDIQQARRERNPKLAGAAFGETEASATQIADTPTADERIARSGVANGRCGVRDPGQDAFLGVGYAARGLARVYSELGAQFTKVPLVSWGRTEPRPPIGGRHNYQWSLLDKLVKEYQDQGFRQMVVLKASSPWASDTVRASRAHRGPGKGAVSAPPKPKHKDDYHQWVAAIVERYDGDGEHDMPGLRYPILHWEVESEVQHEGYWRGTAQEYGEMLRIAYDAVKAACPSAKVVLAGINLGELFLGGPSPEELQKRIDALPSLHKHAADFVRYTLTLVDYYDEIELHYNRHYSTITHELAWVRSELAKHDTDKPIWAGDAISTPWLFSTSERHLLPYSSQAIFDHLTQRRDSDVVRWFRAEQARISVKKIAAGAAAGLRGIILELLQDWSPPTSGKPAAFYKNWMVAGLADASKRPRPAYFAVQQVASLIQDFTAAERIPSNGSAEVYRFRFADKDPLYITWDNNGPHRLVLRVEFPAAAITKTITHAGEEPQTIWQTVGTGELTVNVDETPRLIYTGRGRAVNGK